MPMELAAVRRRMQDERAFPALGGRAVSGRFAGIDVVATTVGVGTRRATETTERVLRAVAVPLVVVVGVAGASAPHLQIADVVVPETAINWPAGTTHTSSTSLAARDRKGAIRTDDELLVGAPAIAAQHRQGVTAMDMETGAIAAVCERLAVPWAAFRGISDTIERPVHPDSMVMLNQDGTPNLGAALRVIARKPHTIPHLVRSGRDTAKACNAAVDAAERALKNLNRP